MGVLEEVPGSLRGLFFVLDEIPRVFEVSGNLQEVPSVFEEDPEMIKEVVWFLKDSDGRPSVQTMYHIIKTRRHLNVL